MRAQLCTADLANFMTALGKFDDKQLQRPPLPVSSVSSGLASGDASKGDRSQLTAEYLHLKQCNGQSRSIITLGAVLSQAVSPCLTDHRLAVVPEILRRCCPCVAKFGRDPLS